MSEPRKGLHEQRIPVLDWALWDVVGTVIAAYVLARWQQWSLWKTTLVLFVLGEVVHYAMGIKTAILGQLSDVFASDTGEDSKSSSTSQ